MAGANKENVFVKEASKAYGRFLRVAKQYHFTFRRPAVTCEAVPFMVFLGNHSSGKSSLINWILEQEVQDTGLAPTDDGFTVIMHGEERQDYRGQAALKRLPAEFGDFGKFGEKFVHGLCVKLRPIEFLKKVSLIDSPGMIDSAEKTSGRDYNFEGVVRTLVELCDMVFYLFDPDKPGTTGETVNIFARSLSGIKYKLHILLNKCDGFSSMYDFARTYGTLCWNLASVLNTKDMPKIWTIYSGPTREGAAGALDLGDFNKHRAEFRAVIDDGAARRRDNLVAQVTSDFRGLSVRMRILNLVWRKCMACRFASWSVIVLLALLPGAVAYLWKGVTITSIAVAAALGLLVLWLGALVARIILSSTRMKLAGMADDLFQREYRDEIAIGTHDDIVETWNEIRAETQDVIRSMPLKLPLFGELRRHRVESVLRSLSVRRRNLV